MSLNDTQRTDGNELPPSAVVSDPDAARLRAAQGHRHGEPSRRPCPESRRRTRQHFTDINRSLDEVNARRSMPKANPNQTPIDPDVWALHVRFARTHDAEVRAELVKVYSGYAAALARRLHREGEPLDDLVQVAMEALILAIERFDPERRLPFVAFAAPTIIGSLKRHYRDLGWGMRVPRRIHEIAAPVRDTTDRLTLELGRSPLVAEVATALGLSDEQVLEAQEATYARSMASLDAPVGEDGSRFDLLGTADPEYGRSENRIALDHAMGDLTDRERQLIQLYYVEELTQTEIGRAMGVSQMQVSRWLASTIRRLRDRMGDDLPGLAAT